MGNIGPLFSAITPGWSPYAAEEEAKAIRGILELAHHCQGVESSQKRVFQVQLWVSDTRSDIRVGGHVPNTVDGSFIDYRFKDGGNGFRVVQIRFEKLEVLTIQALARDEFANRVRDYQSPMTRHPACQKSVYEMASDKSGCAGDEYVLRHDVIEGRGTRALGHTLATVKPNCYGFGSLKRSHVRLIVHQGRNMTDHSNRAPNFK